MILQQHNDPGVPNNDIAKTTISFRKKGVKEPRNSDSRLAQTCHLYRPHAARGLGVGSVLGDTVARVARMRAYARGCELMVGWREIFIKLNYKKESSRTSERSNCPCELRVILRSRVCVVWRWTVQHRSFDNGNACVSESSRQSVLLESLWSIATHYHAPPPPPHSPEAG